MKSIQHVLLSALAAATLCFVTTSAATISNAMMLKERLAAARSSQLQADPERKSQEFQQPQDLAALDKPEAEVLLSKPIANEEPSPLLTSANSKPTLTSKGMLNRKLAALKKIPVELIRSEPRPEPAHLAQPGESESQDGKAEVRVTRMLKGGLSGRHRFGFKTGNMYLLSESL